MPTRDQLGTIHRGAQAVGLIVKGDDARYRLLLQNLAGVTSAKDLDNRGVEDVMAVFEDMGFQGHPGGPDYWRRKVRERGSLCGARMAYRIRERAAAQRYDLAAMVRRFSDGRTDDVEQLHPREAWKLIEGLKAICTREHAAGQRIGAAAGKDAPRAERAAGATDGATLF
jgi:hypothetical protein